MGTKIIGKLNFGLPQIPLTGKLNFGLPQIPLTAPLTWGRVLMKRIFFLSFFWAMGKMGRMGQEYLPPNLGVPTLNSEASTPNSRGIPYSQNCR